MKWLYLLMLFSLACGEPQPEPIPCPPTICAQGPEDMDGFQDDDNCADLDNDVDGILDIKDNCPNVPENKNSFEDEDGCPDELPPEPVQLLENGSFEYFSSDMSSITNWAPVNCPIGATGVYISTVNAYDGNTSLVMANMRCGVITTNYTLPKRVTKYRLTLRVWTIYTGTTEEAGCTSYCVRTTISWLSPTGNIIYNSIFNTGITTRWDLTDTYDMSIPSGAVALRVELMQTASTNNAQAYVDNVRLVVK